MAEMVQNPLDDCGLLNAGDHPQLSAALSAGLNVDGYDAEFNSYNSLSDSLILAWRAKGCARSGDVPLWNACFIGLRGFSATDYIGQESMAGEAELRWQMSPRWGAVAFAGAGYAGNSLAEAGDDQTTPSYGIGARFMVLKSQGINLRVDYAWSEADSAIHLSVGEAF
jgi:hypothetical protein